VKIAGKEKKGILQIESKKSLTGESGLRVGRRPINTPTNRSGSVGATLKKASRRQNASLGGHCAGD